MAHLVKIVFAATRGYEYQVADAADRVAGCVVVALAVVLEATTAFVTTAR